jgi:hypothetical protein
MGCFRYPCIPRMSGRPRFSRDCFVSDSRPDIHRASVSVTGGHLILTGHGPCTPPQPPLKPTLDEHIRSLAALPGYWSLWSVQSPHDCSVIAAELTNGSIIVVSDGSYYNSFGTAAWVLQGTHFRCTGQVICPGSAIDQNSYRSEISGLLSILVMIDQVVRFFQYYPGLPGGSMRRSFRSEQNLLSCLLCSIRRPLL